MEAEEEEDTVEANSTTTNKTYSDGSLLEFLRQLAKRVVRHHAFDSSVGFVIILNSICIGVEQQLMLDSIESPILDVLEDFFLTFYIVELLIRLLAGGLAQLRDTGILFDVILVTVSITAQWIIGDKVRPMVVIRIARLARLARSVRLLIMFRDLWKLVHGLLASSGVMFYTMILIGMIIFAFSLVGLELITIRYISSPTNDPQIEAIVDEYFSSLLMTMLTLTQFVTMDSIGAIYRPLVRDDPVLACYFLFLILVIGIVMMNLITAVLVNGALEQAEQNKEANRIHEAKQKKRVLKELRNFFHAIDCDHSGTLDCDELQNASEDITNFIRGYMKVGDLQEVFHHLDIDGNGELAIEEFCEGLYQAMTSQTPLEFKRIDKRVDNVRVHVQELLTTQSELLKKLSDITKNMQGESQPVPSKPMLPHDKAISCAVQCPAPVCDAEVPVCCHQIFHELRKLRTDFAAELKAPDGVLKPCTLAGEEGVVRPQNDGTPQPPPRSSPNGASLHPNNSAGHVCVDCVSVAGLTQQTTSPQKQTGWRTEEICEHLV